METGTLGAQRADYSRKQALVWGLLIGAWIGGPVFAVRRFLMYGHAGAIGQDAHAYWLTAHGHLYDGAPGAHDSYLYSPLFAQLIRPLAELPFGWFTTVVIAVDVACFAWLLAPLGWRWAVPLLFFMAQGFVLGNIIGLVTVAAVLGVSGRSGWWAIGWLTKVTPGAIGGAWHVGRGEWRRLGVSLASTAVAVGVSAVFWPSAWLDWIDFLHASGGGPWVAVRLLFGLALAFVGGRRRWWWAVPVALAISAPVLGQGTIGYLAGLVRLCSDQRRVGGDPGRRQGAGVDRHAGHQPAESLRAARQSADP